MLILGLILICYPSSAFSSFFFQVVHTQSVFNKMNTHGQEENSMTRSLLHPYERRLYSVRSLFNSNKIPRGGSDVVAVEDNEEMIDLDVLSSEDSSSSTIIQTHTSPIPSLEAVSSTNNSKSTVFSRAFLPPLSILSSLQRFTNMYSNALIHTPIITKSLTAGFIFALSDYTAQKMNSSSNLSNKEDMNWIRTISSGLVGLLYFGPAAHVWYQMIFQLLPGTSLVSTLGKATLGQLIFGPSFTCVFFAVSLLQDKSFTFMNWWTKIQVDLPRAWLAGLSFWPLVDLVSYSIVPKDYIPLFVNFCSFIWTIYLSIVANQKK